MLERKPHVLLVAFLVGLVALNAWRLEAWGVDGIVRYLSDPVVQTTWFDFAAVLAILLVFIHRDAKKHGLTWWWILPTFPFTPAAREAILGDYVNLEARVELDLGAVLEALLPLPAPTDQDGEDGPVPALPALPDLQDPLGVLDDLDDLVSGLADLPLLGGPTGSAPSGPDSGGLLGGLLGGGS